ncbi:hydroxyacylglutathione hydrolase, mitochondrial isoform X1 [Rhizophagus clarus]|uniref:hydroxyacylglutathione hydrolase n=1 Tax=Rhizophagus clarus TaxID=94130 RepID=A0A8H3MCS9_9GLOM|nr:hydroxyacylglutathione hydrolase, mitochondrial isoform X1 [Rhizophagus clarus]
MLRSGLKILSKKSVNYMWANKKRMIFQTVCNNMKVIPVPVLQDNYSYLVIDEKTNEAAVVDPVEPEKVLKVANEQGVNLKHLITTHHHDDHSGGNTNLVKEKPDLIVYGGDNRIPSVTNIVKDNEEFKIGQIDVKALFTICHTSASVSFYLQDKNDRAVFTGDTLFIGGCGRFFEASVEPDNEFLQQKIQWANENERTVPSTIGDELNFNPFMRVDKESIKKATGKQDPVEVMAALREMKNKF